MTNIDNKIPSLAFIYPDTFPQDVIDDDLSEVQTNGLDIRIIKRENGAFAAFEWVVPTAFGVYILKPYFDSFLSEAGKDHYSLLKKTLSKILKRGKQSKEKFIAASQSTDKLSKTYSQSIIVSFEFQTIDNRHIKLLFDNNLNFEDWQIAIDQMLVLMDNNFSSYPNDILTLEIAKLNTQQNRIIYVLINTDTKQLEFMDDTKMLQKFK
jgi:hypothetical protein